MTVDNTPVTTRGNPARGFLNNDEMRAMAPSIFTDHAGPGATNRYQLVKTIDVIDTMRAAGYVPVKAGQSSVRTDGGGIYNKHIVRLMHKDYLAMDARRVGDVVPQVLLQNSHNRSSAFHLSAGLFRLTCSNGLAVSCAALAGLRVLHNDTDIHKHIIQGTNLVRQITDDVITPQVEAMTRKVLSKAMEREFALAATFLKWGEVKEDQVDHLLTVQREGDDGRSLWQVLNRIQENAVKGGYQTVNRAGHTMTARPISSIARDVDFNVNLWTLGAKVLEAA